MVKRVRLTRERARSTPKERTRIGKEKPSDKKRSSKKLSSEKGPVEREEPISHNGNYKVGRGKPPKDTQFKKGDGRKRPGRPKGSKNLATIIMEAARDQVTVTIDGKKRKISKKQSAAIQLANAGATGNPRLLVKFLDLIAEIEAQAEATRPSEYPFSDVDIKIIREIYKRLRPYDERIND